MVDFCRAGRSMAPTRLSRACDLRGERIAGPAQSDGAMRCPLCDVVVGASDRFCGECGAVVAPASAPELRQVTVLFYDLANSTRLAQAADPDDFSAALA